MCDTMVALGNATADGSVIFAKNSDRHPNEAHHLLLVPGKTHAAGAKVKCTYIEVPQVEKTLSALLAKPFWIWGTEMGANEKGVVIGNEAVFAKMPAEKKPALIGMDFIRLALERSSNASEALRTITNLLETYGQGGNCGFGSPMYYHNSYLIADAHEAWVLETVDRQWAAQKVTDVRSISNGLTIESEWDLASDGLIDLALEKGWWKKGKPFNFRAAYSDKLYTSFSDSRRRQVCTSDLLRRQLGSISVASMMAILRSHRADRSRDWSPAGGIVGADVCMHAGFGPIRISQTTGSMISHLSAEQRTHWVTGTAAPCTGIFKPVWMDSGLPDLGTQPMGEYDSASLYWRHELLHRQVLRDYAHRLSRYAYERSQMEDSFVDKVSSGLNKKPAERLAVSRHCFEAASEATDRWLKRVRSAPIRQQAPLYSALAWNGFNRAAKLPE